MKWADFDLIPQTNILIFTILFQRAKWTITFLSLKQTFWKYVLNYVKLTLPQHFLQKGKWCYLEDSVFISLFKYYTRVIVPLLISRILIRNVKSIFHIFSTFREQLYNDKGRRAEQPDPSVSPVHQTKFGNCCMRTVVL